MHLIPTLVLYLLVQDPEVKVSVTRANWLIKSLFVTVFFAVPILHSFTCAQERVLPVVLAAIDLAGQAYRSQIVL